MADTCECRMVNAVLVGNGLGAGSTGIWLSASFASIGVLSAV